MWWPPSRGTSTDIGKNIVKTLLENYGYDVIDLGRDVPPETVAGTVREKDVRLVGLSADDHYPALHGGHHPPAAHPAPAAGDFRGRRGGHGGFMQRAWGRTYYAKDARQSVEIARSILG